MIRKEHFYFTSSQGETKIHSVRWEPEGRVKAVVQLVHGMAEYIERYDAFAHFLAEQGIVVAGHDHLGHGESVSSSEDFGYFAPKNGNRALVQDIQKVTVMTKKDYPDVPYVIFGHSMGSFLTRQYICCHGTEVDGAVICGTGNQPEAVIRAGLAVCRIEAAIFGWRHRSRLMKQMSFGSYNRAFRPRRTAFDWLSRNEENVDGYLADEKCGFDFTLNGYYNLLLTMLKNRRKEYLERMPRDLPVLFIAGDKDPVGANGKGVRDAEQMFLKVGMRNVASILYQDDRHEILNENDRQDVFEDVLGWMKENQLVK